MTIATTVNVAESTGLLNSVSILKPSSECEEVLHPFLCLHLFKPCGEDGQLLYPSSDMCTSVRDQFCSEEWTKVELSLGKDFLPVCESLPLQSACNNTGDLYVMCTSDLEITSPYLCVYIYYNLHYDVNIDTSILFQLSLYVWLHYLFPQQCCLNFHFHTMC